MCKIKLHIIVHDKTTCIVHDKTTCIIHDKTTCIIRDKTTCIIHDYFCMTYWYYVHTPLYLKRIANLSFKPNKCRLNSLAFLICLAYSD